MLWRGRQRPGFKTAETWSPSSAHHGAAASVMGRGLTFREGNQMAGSLKHCVLLYAVLLGGWDRKLLLLGMLRKPRHHQASLPSEPSRPAPATGWTSLTASSRGQTHRPRACMVPWSYRVRICASSCDPHDDRQCRAGRTSAPSNAIVSGVWSPATLKPRSLPPDEILGWRKLTRDPMAHSLRDPSRCPVTRNT